MNKEKDDLKDMISILIEKGFTDEQIASAIVAYSEEIPAQAPPANATELDRVVAVIGKVVDNVSDLTTLKFTYGGMIGTVSTQADLYAKVKVGQMVVGTNTHTADTYFVGTCVHIDTTLNIAYLEGHEITITDPVTGAGTARPKVSNLFALGAIPVVLGEYQKNGSTIAITEDWQWTNKKFMVDYFNSIKYWDGAAAANLLNANGNGDANILATVAETNAIKNLKVFDNETGAQVNLSTMDGSNTSKTLATQHHISKFGTIKVAQSAGAENNLGTLTGADTNNKLASQGYVDTHAPDLSAYNTWNNTVGELARRKFKRADNSVVGFTDLNDSGLPVVTGATVDYVDAKVAAGGSLTKTMTITYDDGSTETVKVG